MTDKSLTSIVSTEDSYGEAQRVLREEGRALLGLAEALPQSFEHVVQVLLKVPGKVVTSGIGKSGHIAQKIAATMASLGTPSFFLHPSEAVHGDLGMLSPHHDALLLFSHSGETQELFGIACYGKDHHIPTLLVTARGESTLCRYASLVLLIPAYAEACGMGLAPTTSSTMMLGLGDALAVVLSKRRGFGKEEYKKFHPGGQLGKHLRRIREVMLKGERLPLVRENVTMEKAILEMSSKLLGCVGVVDHEGALLGMISDGDLRRHMAKDLLNRRVDEVMTKNPITISGDVFIGEALELMNEKRVTSLFIVEENSQVPLGIIHIHACLG